MKPSDIRRLKGCCVGAVGVQFVGGPMDGREAVIPGDLTDPPAEYEVMQCSLHGGVRRITYARQLNPGNSGPLWFYRYAREGAA